MPFYTAQPDWWSILHITNTTNAAVPVRLHFREGLNGRNVRTLIVALSPFDVFTGLVQQGPGGVPILRVIDQPSAVKGDRKTCTIPQSTAADGSSIALPFTSESYDNTDAAFLPDLGLSAIGDAVEGIGDALDDELLETIGLTQPRNFDGGPTSIRRAAEGWIEVVSMGFTDVQKRETPSAPGQTPPSRPPLVDANGVINVGEAIERNECDLLDIAFSNTATRTDDNEGNVPRIVDTARQFGEPINALKVDSWLVNFANGKEAYVPVTSLANFYNPGAQLESAEDLRLLELTLSDQIDLDVNLGVLGDIGALQLIDLLRISVDGLGPFGEGLGLVFDGLEDFLAGSGPLPPESLTCNRGMSPCGDDMDKFVFPEDNASCTITRDAQRKTLFFDWQPDGGARPDGILRSLALALNNLEPSAEAFAEQAAAIQSIVEVYVANLINPFGGNEPIQASSCRNLITAGFGAEALEPSLNDVYPARARFHHDSENDARVLIPFASTPNGYNLPEDKRGIDALSLLLMRQTAMNDWGFDGNNLRAQWVMTQPTKPFYTDRSGGQNVLLVGEGDGNGLGLLDDASIHSAVSPRAPSPILTAPLGTDLASSTSRPESILRSELRVLAANTGFLDDSSLSEATAFLAAGIGIPEADPYAPFRESYGDSRIGVNAVAGACNDVGFAILDRAENTVRADGTPSPAVDTLVVAPFLPVDIGETLGLRRPAANLQTQLCFGVSNVQFASAPVVTTNPDLVIDASDVAAAVGVKGGWAFMDLDLFGRNNTIDVGEVAALEPVRLDPLAQIDQSPEDGAYMGYFQLQDIDRPQSFFEARYARGLPIIAFGLTSGSSISTSRR
ncbi:MAG: hypothetical protein ABF296_06200 [Oceanococcaceae bacterium]